MRIFPSVNIGNCQPCHDLDKYPISVKLADIKEQDICSPVASTASYSDLSNYFEICLVNLTIYLFHHSLQKKQQLLYISFLIANNYLYNIFNSIILNLKMYHQILILQFFSLLFPI